MVKSKNDIKMLIVCVVLSFVLGLFVRTALLVNENPKMAFYQTFEPSITMEVAEQ